MLPPKLRFSQTLLSYANRSIAVNDEMMIDKSNGNLYYKKPDGTIISCSGSTYAENISAFESIYALGLVRGDIWTGQCNTGLYIVSQTTIPELHAMEPCSLGDRSYLVDTHSNYLFLNLRTRDEDKHYAALLTALRNAKMAIPDETNAEIYFNIDVIQNVETPTGEFDDEGNEITEMVPTVVDSLDYDASVTMNKMSKVLIPYKTFWKRDAYKAYLAGPDTEEDGTKISMTKFVELSDEVIGEKSGLTKAQYIEDFRENNLYLEFTVLEIRPTIEYSENTEKLRESDLFEYAIPADGRIKYFKITAAYFTHSYETVYIDSDTTIITVMDVHSALDAFETGDIRGYIDYTILPIIRRLYNAGLNNSSQYILDFTEEDWKWDELTQVYKLYAPSTVHNLKKEILAEIYFLRNGLYRTHFGVWDEINYKIFLTPDNDITVTTEEPFAGRLICRNFSAMGTTEEDWKDIPTTGFGDLGDGIGSASDMDIENMFEENSKFLDGTISGEESDDEDIEKMFNFNTTIYENAEVTADDESDEELIQMFKDNTELYENAEAPEDDGIIDDVEQMFMDNTKLIEDEQTKV